MMILPKQLLRWQYLGRLTVAGGIFCGAVWVWPQTAPEATLLATLALLLSIGVTLPSFWRTHVEERVPGRTFLYGQVVYDALLVTVVVHLTGGAESDLAPLYILVIAASAVLLPLPGGMLVGALSSAFYFADIVWGHASPPPGTVVIQIVLFAMLALVTGYLGDRLRRAGTALGEVESELRQLRLDTSEILGALGTGVVTVDAMGGIAYLNPAAEALLGLRRIDWIRSSASDVLDARAPGLGRAIRDTARTGLPVVRAEARLAGAPDRVIGLQTTLLDREGAPWVTAVFQDITDSKRVEALNRRAERLAAVAELSASLAHEIKNPLASIRSAVEQIAAEGLAVEDRQTLERLVSGESDRLSRLLSEFLEFSRVEVHRPATFDFRGVVRRAHELARQHPDGRSGVRVDLVEPERPVEVEGDEDLLHRAVFNLVLNAVQHAGESGRVRVELDRVAPREVPPGLDMRSALRLVVADTGPGVPVEHLPRLFDPFFTTRRGGSGLGLALVHRALQAHNGTVFVGTGPDGGAEFTVYLPTDDAARANSDTTPAHALAGTG